MGRGIIRKMTAAVEQAWALYVMSYKKMVRHALMEMYVLGRPNAEMLVLVMSTLLQCVGQQGSQVIAVEIRTHAHGIGFCAQGYEVVPHLLSLSRLL